jgi:hypothetical protein
MAGSTEAVELPILPETGGTRVGFFRVGTTIENVQYIIDGRWNSRDAAWYLDFYEGDLTPIIYGVKVVLGAYLARRSNHPLFANGVLVAVDLTNSGKEATFDDFGTRVILEWIPVLELLRRLRAADEVST